MISLLLTILKIIGITLLVILGIILLVLSLILFVPVRYRAIGNYYDQNTYAVEGRITWLLHVISAKAVYHANQPFHLCLRLFGIPIYDNLKTGTCKIRRTHRSFQDYLWWNLQPACTYIAAYQWCYHNIC